MLSFGNLKSALDSISAILTANLNFRVVTLIIEVISEVQSDFFKGRKWKTDKEFMDSFDIVRGIRYWCIGKCFGRFSAFTTNEAAIFWQYKTVSVQSNQASLDEWVSFEEPEVNFHNRK